MRYEKTDIRKSIYRKGCFGLLVMILTLLPACNDTQSPDTSQSTEKTMPPSSERPTIIAAVGDSITWGALAFGKKADSGGYPLILESTLRASGYDVVIFNKGIPGEKAFQTRERFSQSIADADIVLLMIGTNDLLRSEGCPDPDNCRTAEHIDAMIDLALQAGIVPFVSTLPPAQPNCARSWMNPPIQALNDQISTVVQKHEIPLIQTHQAITEHGWDGVYSDCLHPTDKGYNIIAEQWYAALIESQHLKRLERE